MEIWVRVLLWWKSLAFVLLGVFAQWAAYRILAARTGVATSTTRLVGYGLHLTLFGMSLVLAILTTPVSDATHGQLLGFFGILVSGAIALSSTTLLGNAMAGVMLRAVGSFRPGDFIRVDEHFGRVTELQLLHTEIQTQDRDLTTLPNLFLVQQPVRVIQACGTVVAATCSLGYDVPRREIEEALLDAVVEAGLRDPFVQVLELGDYSVTFRAAGFLDDIKVLLTSRSKLRAQMIDQLHLRGIEIVSPRFINQRVYPKDETFMHVDVAAPAPAAAAPATGLELSPESRIFDKADAAESREQIVDTIQQIEARITDLKSQAETLTAVELKRQVGREITRLDALKAELTTSLEGDGGAGGGGAEAEGGSPEPDLDAAAAKALGRTPDDPAAG